MSRMMSNCDSDRLSPDEELVERHHKENKELQERVEQLKRSSAKSDRRQKRGVSVRIAQMEAEVQTRQEQELSQLQQATAAADLPAVVAKLTTLEVVGNGSDNVQSDQPKLNRAQKRREKKAKEERERLERIKQEEAENLTGPRNMEAINLKNMLARRNLVIHEIASDGDCLYAAVLDQLSRRNIETTVGDLRRQTANQMRDHSDDYLPFLYSAETDNPYTPDEFQVYCEKVESSKEWGGQLETRALSTALRVAIEVIQADGPSVVTGDEFTDAPLTISYHRYAFGLGEHYSSVVAREASADDDQPPIADS